MSSTLHIQIFIFKHIMIIPCVYEYCTMTGVYNHSICLSIISRMQQNLAILNDTPFHGTLEPTPNGTTIPHTTNVPYHLLPCYTGTTLYTQQPWGHTSCHDETMLPHPAKNGTIPQTTIGSYPLQPSHN